METARPEQLVKLLDEAEEQLATAIRQHIDEKLREMHRNGRSPHQGWRLAVRAEKHLDTEDGMQVRQSYGFAEIPPGTDLSDETIGECLIFGWQ